MIISTDTCKPELKADFIRKILTSGWQRVSENEFYWPSDRMGRC